MPRCVGTSITQYVVVTRLPIGYIAALLEFPVWIAPGRFHERQRPMQAMDALNLS